MAIFIRLLSKKEGAATEFTQPHHSPLMFSSLLSSPKHLDLFIYFVAGRVFKTTPVE